MCRSTTGKKESGKGPKHDELNYGRRNNGKQETEVIEETAMPSIYMQFGIDAPRLGGITVSSRRVN